jgi:CheY-like chemotaxis protein
MNEVEGEVEAVAKAFYDAQKNARGWLREPEVLKDPFRRNARAVIEALERHRTPVISKVLVVEDEKDIRDLAVFYLEEAGFTVITATNGDEAVELLEGGEAPDVLFTDIRMPGHVDGSAVARAYRARFPDMPVFYGTNYAYEVTAVPGATVFPKPYKMSHVVSFLSELKNSCITKNSGAG